jgi:hypothetical protein
MFETVATAQQLLSANKWWGTQSLTVQHTLIAPEDACQNGMDAVKKAGGAADEDMPAGFCACPQIYVGDHSCACPYQHNNAVYN